MTINLINKRNIFFVSLVLISAVFFLFENKGETTVYIIRDASTLSRGTLPNQRLDPSSVTLLGNNFLFGISDSTQSFSNVLLVADEGTVQSSFTVLNFAGGLVSLACSGSTCTATITEGGSGLKTFISTSGYLFIQDVSTIVFSGQFVSSASFTADLSTIVFDITKVLNLYKDFGIANSTGIEIGGVQLTTYFSTADTVISEKVINSAGVIGASMTTILDSTNTFTASQIFKSSMTISGNNPIFEVIEGTGIFRAIVVTTGTFGNLIAHGTFTALSISSFNSVVYISSYVMIQSTQKYNVALIIGNGLDPPNVNTNFYMSNNGSTQFEVRDSLNNTQAVYQATSGQVNFGAQTQTPFAIVTNGLERMRISATGLFGLGNTNPQTLAHMSGTADPTFAFNDTNDGVTGIFAAVGGVNDYVVFGTTSPHATVIVSSNIIRIYVSSGGMIGQGTSTPTAKSHVFNSTSSTNKTNEAFSFAVSTTTDWYHFSVSSKGYVNFASSSPSHALSSCGTGPTIYGGGSAFTVTPGGGAPTGCTITFGVPFQRPPVPIITSRSGVGPAYTLTEKALTLTLTGIGVTDVVLIGADR